MPKQLDLLMSKRKLRDLQPQHLFDDCSEYITKMLNMLFHICEEDCHVIEVYSDILIVLEDLFHHP